jgi:isopentenyl phosphate kinase
MILIKLGGSIITNKEKPLAARKKTIDNLSKSLKKINEPIIIVHGGGSYGHYWSVKYDMHTKEKKYDLRGVAIVKNSMIELNKIILDSMLKNKLNPYCLPPTDFMSGNKPITKKIKEIEKIAKSGLIPVTYGDALWYGQKKTYILSGDKIMTHLAKILKPKLCIFALNEDGLYSDLKSKKLIYELQGERPTISENKMDVTGGMTRKVEEASKIAKMGLNVFFANGNKPERIVKAVKNRTFEGTLLGDLFLQEEQKKKCYGQMIGMEHLQVIQENQKHMFHQEKEECLKSWELMGHWIIYINLNIMFHTKMWVLKMKFVEHWLELLINPQN